jgi:hypothetical protein
MEVSGQIWETIAQIIPSGQRALGRRLLRAEEGRMRWIHFEYSFVLVFENWE